MKKEGIGVLLGMVFCLILVIWAMTLSNRYRKQAEVVKVDRGGILFEDVNGNLWAIDYEKGYKVGDTVIITFDSQDTWDCVEDDEIISVNKQD